MTPALLHEHKAWWHKCEITRRERSSIQVSQLPPSHHGRLWARKLRLCGWFIVVDPGLIPAVQENQTTNAGKSSDSHIILCQLRLKCAASHPTLRKIRHWCMDNFHTKGHSGKCPPCPLLVQNALARRVKKVNAAFANRLSNSFEGTPVPSWRYLSHGSTMHSCVKVIADI